MNGQKVFLLFLFCVCGLFLRAMPLPAQREVIYTDPSGESWREEGRIPLSVVAARQMWELAFRKDGWRFVRIIPLDFTCHKHLEVWEKGDRTAMLCLWSVSPGSSGYLWGTMNKNHK